MILSLLCKIQTQYNNTIKLLLNVNIYLSKKHKITEQLGECCVAQRIKTIQEKKVQQVEDGIASEFQGIINYCVIGLIQLENGTDIVEDLPVSTVSVWYDEKMNFVKNIMLQKNHDYGEAWRSMSQESFVDLILMKILRIKQILTNEGKTLASEGIDANYVDMLNYAVFALILMM